MANGDVRKILTTIRRALFWLFLAGLIGTGTELLLMGHTEDVVQLIPLLLIGLSMIALGWITLRGDTTSITTFRGIMLLMIASGAIGSVLHYRGNIEFEIEMSPALSGVDLFQEAVTGATPTLAPGTMILLGALGLVFTLVHSRLRTTSTSSEES
jgi:hypothetical protein